MEKKNNWSLDEWVKQINAIYEQSNGERDFKDVLLFSFEEVGRCSQLVNRDHDDQILDIIPRLFKWFSILYAKSGIKLPVSDMIWNKFPGICPYCKHSSCGCMFSKERFNYYDLVKKAEETRDFKPKTLDEWQGLFEKIYSRNGDYKMEKNVSHLFEELSELSEVHRLHFIEADKDLVGMELADVFSWIMGFANYYDQRRKNRRYLLSDALEKSYGNLGCPDCSEFRKNHNINNCCCSVKPQSLMLVSDYIEKSDANTDEPSPKHKDRDGLIYQ